MIINFYSVHDCFDINGERWTNNYLCIIKCPIHVFIHTYICTYNKWALTIAFHFPDCADGASSTSITISYSHTCVLLLHFCGCHGNWKLSSLKSKSECVTFCSFMGNKWKGTAALRTLRIIFSILVTQELLLSCRLQQQQETCSCGH